jgi:drug/metabolite transporter (DMT)-like permease
MKNLGIVLIAIGVLMTVFTGFSVFTKKKVVDFGSVEINKTEKTPIYWSPITGLVLMAAGGLVLITNRKK